MKSKITILLSIILVTAVWFIAGHRNAANRPNDLRDAMADEKAPDFNTDIPVINKDSVKDSSLPVPTAAKAVQHAAGEVAVEIFVMAEKCDKVEGDASTSSWQAGEKWVFFASELAKGKIVRTDEKGKGTITVTVSSFKAEGGKDRIKAKARYVAKDMSGMAAAKLTADLGVLALSSSGACESASDIGTITLNMSMTPKYVLGSFPVYTNP